MNTTALQKPKTKRKLIYFVVFILLAIAIFTAGWFWAAGKVDSTLNQTKANLASNGTILDCKEQDVKGYPFRLGVFCSSLIFVDPVNAITVKAEAFRSAAQLYNPGHMVAELDSPVELEMPNLAPLAIDWQNLITSSKISTSGLQRLSINSKQFTVSANDAGFKTELGKIENLQLHARPTPSDPSGKSLDVAADLTNWKVADDGQNIIEPIDLKIDLSIDELIANIESGYALIDVLRTQGGKGDIKNLQITTSTGGEIKIAGDLQISQKGLLSGTLNLNITDPKTLIAYTAKIFPPAQSALEQGLPFIESFAKQSDGKLEIKDVIITLRNGEIMLGFFKVGEIPRLF